jgi:hypothetical protein
MTDGKFKLISKNLKDNEFNIDLLKKKRSNQNYKQPNLSIPEFLQDKSQEKKDEYDFTSILDDKIKALNSCRFEKGSEKSN